MEKKSLGLFDASGRLEVLDDGALLARELVEQPHAGLLLARSVLGVVHSGRYEVCRRLVCTDDRVVVAAGVDILVSILLGVLV